jgi:polyisoprenoid-binding protein YceI
VTRAQTLKISLVPGARPDAGPSGFRAEGVIHRSDFGMVADPFLVGDTIRLRIRVNFDGTAPASMSTEPEDRVTQ